MRLVLTRRVRREAVRDHLLRVGDVVLLERHLDAVVRNGVRLGHGLRVRLGDAVHGVLEVNEDAQQRARDALLGEQHA